MLNFFDENPAYENHVLFTDGSGQSVTYQDWYAHSKNLGKILSSPNRQLAAIICHNTIGSALSYLCCLQKSNRPFTNRSRYGCGTAPAVIIYL